MNINKTINKKKIIIGTANFSLEYGIVNNFKKIKTDEIKKVIKTCEDNNLNFIDTAKGYGDSEKLIGEYKKKNFNIITKIPKIYLQEEKKITNYITDLIHDSLKKLKVKNFYAILLHDENQLLSKNSKYIYKILKKLQKKKLFNKLGVSFYCPKKLIKTISLFNIDVVQLPINYLNQTFLNENLLSLLKKKNIEIHARSIFQQGILIKKNIKIKKFKNFSNYLDLWHKESKFSRLETAINFIDSQRYIDKYIIGFQNSKQILQILNTKKVKITSYPDYKDNYLKDPRRWKHLKIKK